MKIFLEIIFTILLSLILGISPVFGKALTLNDSIEIAKENNPSVIASRQRVTAAEGAAGQAFSPFLPQLNLEGSIGRSYQQPYSISAADFGIPGTFEGSVVPDEAANLITYQASLTQSLFTGGKVWGSFNIANKNLEISKQDLRGAMQDLIYDVTVAYYGVLKAKKFVELNNESLNMAKSHLDQVKVMFDAGTVTKADVLQSEVQVANAEINLTKAKSALEIAKNSFNNVLGRNLNEKVDISEEEFIIEEFTAPRYEEFLREAYEGRPDWKQFILGKEISENSVALARSGYFPSIAIVGTYGNTKTEYAEHGRTDDLNSWTAILSGSWNIFDGLSTPNKVKEAEANLKAQKADEDMVKNGIALEVKDACFNLNTATETIKMAKKALEFAEENYRISELRYNAGVGTNIEVIDAQTALTQARLQYLEAQYDYEIAKARINKVTGKEIFKKVGIPIKEEKIITLRGIVKYIPLEGGFIGFIDDAGNKYDLLGEKVIELKDAIAEKEEKRIKIIGRPKRGIITIHMWGTPFEVIDYEWQ